MESPKQPMKRRIAVQTVRYGQQTYNVVSVTRGPVPDTYEVKFDYTGEWLDMGTYPAKLYGKTVVSGSLAVLFCDMREERWLFVGLFRPGDEVG